MRSPMPVWAVTPQRDAQPAKVRHAVQALKDYLLTLPGVRVAPGPLAGLEVR